MTQQEFIDRFKNKYPQYDYSQVEYKNSYSKIKIICPKHGEFILRGDNWQDGCPYCFNRKTNTLSFIEKAKKIHFDNYDYSFCDYINAHTKVKIKCLKCGLVFEQKPNDHLNNHGCSFCGGTRKSNTNNFIEKAKKVHSNNYDYSIVSYTNNFTKVKIKCLKCGLVFEQTPKDHLNGNGCPKCKTSKGELKILDFLTENNIDFIHQKKFNDLKDKSLLSFDFYIPSKNLLIEYNGIQHYEPSDFYGGRKKFLLQKHHDWLKRKYAKKNGYELLTIKYNQDILNELFTKFP